MLEYTASWLAVYREAGGRVAKQRASRAQQQLMPLSRRQTTSLSVLWRHVG